MRRNGSNPLKVAALLFLSGFYLGYTVRFFDIIPETLDSGYLYPLYPLAKASSWVLPYFRHGLRPSSLSALDVTRYNLFPAALLIATGSLFALPTMILLFIIGFFTGMGLVEIVQYAPVGAALYLLLTTGLFTASMLYCASTGFHLCSSVTEVIEGGEFRLSKTLLDHLLLSIGITLLSIAVQIMGVRL